MKKKIATYLLIILSVSFLFNIYLENKLYHSFTQIKLENISNLEHKSNRNFYKGKIENIGNNLQRELLTMNIEKCSIRVREDIFFIFQKKKVYVINNEKIVEIEVKYNFCRLVFQIIGFETLEVR